MSQTYQGMEGSTGTSPEPLTIAQQAVLTRAVAKTILLGACAGITPDLMIFLLKSGLTVSELIDYVKSQNCDGTLDAH